MIDNLMNVCHALWNINVSMEINSFFCLVFLSTNRYQFNLLAECINVLRNEKKNYFDEN